jgi:hypothetical protein
VLKVDEGHGSGIYITASVGKGQQFSECSRAVPTSEELAIDLNDKPEL